MLTTFDAFYASELSDNLSETPEGFLICGNVKIARIGTQIYLGQELGLSKYYNQKINVYRLPEDVFSEYTLASFEGKPVTDDHPSQGVSIENYSNYAKGHAQNIRRDGDYIVADLVITDSILIDKIRNRVKREVSAGYNCEYVPHEDGYRQKSIIGNHIAVVDKGRAGPKVAINDSETKRSYFPMNQFDLMAAGLQAMAKDATPEQFAKALTAVMDSAKSGEQQAQPVQDAETKAQKGFFAKLESLLAGKRPAKDEESEAEEKEEKAADEESSELKEMKDRIAALEALQTARDEDPENETEDEDPEAEKADDEDPEEEPKSANDSAAALAEALKAIKPMIAKLPAKDQQAVKDAFAKAQGKPAQKASVYGKIKKAVASYQTTDRATAHENLGQKLAEQFNPHYKV